MSFRSFDLLSLVRDFGSELTLRKVNSGGVYDPTTGEFDTSEDKTYIFVGYMYNYDTGFSGNTDTIVRGMRKCVIPALGLEVSPEDGDTIEGNNDKVRITRVTTQFSGSVAVCHICEVSE